MDRNPNYIRRLAMFVVSLSARRAWIEILIFTRQVWLACVALRKESVDRNYIIKITETAPRRSLSARRAWIEILLLRVHLFFAASLSARRAWIEITPPKECSNPEGVALRKESVDRNVNSNSNFTQKKHVALRKESVDRNALGSWRFVMIPCRSPQGERG